MCRWNGWDGNLRRVKTGGTWARPLLNNLALMVAENYGVLTHFLWL
jgi:hypothetical protein